MESQQTQLSPDLPKPVVNQVPPEKPVSILPVILIFLGIFLILIVIIVSVFLFIILPKIKNAKQNISVNNNKIQLDNYKIKTSDCQIGTYKIIDAAPSSVFAASLGPCDSSYIKYLLDSGKNWSSQQYPELKNSATLAIEAAQNNFQKGVAMSWLGQYYYDARDVAAAETTLMKSIELAPEFSESYSLLSATYRVKKDFLNAETYGKKCVDLNPLYAYCHANYGIALIANGKEKEGSKELEEAMSLQPTNQNLRDVYKSWTGKTINN